MASGLTSVCMSAPLRAAVELATPIKADSVTALAIGETICAGRTRITNASETQAPARDLCIVRSAIQLTASVRRVAIT